MSRFTILTYRFFKSHRLIFHIILWGTFAVFLFLGLQVSYEEDISKLLPSNGLGGENSEQIVFNNLKVKDKVFVLFIARNDSVNTDELIATADDFVDSLIVSDTDSTIANILCSLDLETLTGAVDYLYSNLPVLFDSTDYSALDSLFTPEALAVRMEENMADLESATGAYQYQLIQYDPAGIRYAMGSKAMEMSSGFGGSFRIIDQHFLTPDSTVAVAFISPAFSGLDSKTGIRLAEHLEECIGLMKEQHPDVEILFHGAPIQSVFNSRQIKSDLIMTMGVSLLLVCLLIAYCFKNRSTLPLMLAPVIYGTMFALAIIYLAQGTMSLMAIGIGAIVLGVAISYCLHVLTHYKYVTDPEIVLAEQTKPVILGSLTTIGAFLGLVLTDSALLSDFGLFAALAMVGTTIFCLLFLPQFLDENDNRRSEKAFNMLNRINALELDKQKWLVALLTVICAVCIYESQYVGFDNDLKNIGYINPDVDRSAKILNEKSNHGNQSQYFAVTARSLDSALVYNTMLNEYLDTLKAEGIISAFSKTSTILLPYDVQQERIDRWNSYWTPSKKAEVCRNLINAGEPYGIDDETMEPFLTLLESSFEPNSILEAGVLPDELMSNWMEYTDSTYMIFTSVQMTPDSLNPVCDKVVESPHTLVIDPFYYTQDMVSLLNKDFNRILMISTIFVFIVLLISFRSITLAAIAFMPMGLSWYVVLGIMALTGLKFNLINIVISTFIFGVGVDYSIFIMDGLLSGGKKPNLLVYHKTAIFLSAVTLIISIASLILAQHPALKSVGIATLIGMLATLLITYTLQPFVFHLLEKNSFFNSIISKAKQKK